MWWVNDASSVAQALPTGFFKSFGVAFTALFVALDIVGIIPLYVGLTRSLDPVARNQIVNQSMIVAFGTAVVFALVGKWIFQFLGITVGDFQIAGGLVLLLTSLAELMGGPQATHREATGSTGIVPLAVPLITGPGVITTLILQVNSLGYFVTFLSVVINYAIAWFLLKRSDIVIRLMGRDGATVVSKIAALLLAAIAMAMIRSGLFAGVRAFLTQTP